MYSYINVPFISVLWFYMDENYFSVWANSNRPIVIVLMHQNVIAKVFARNIKMNLCFPELDARHRFLKNNISNKPPLFVNRTSGAAANSSLDSHEI
jgi:hypothetical protein